MLNQENKNRRESATQSQTSEISENRRKNVWSDPRPPVAGGCWESCVFLIFGAGIGENPLDSIFGLMIME